MRFTPVLALAIFGTAIGQEKKPPLDPKVFGRVDWVGDLEVGLLKAKLEGRGAVLFFPSRSFSEGPFASHINDLWQNDDVVNALKLLVPIVVDREVVQSRELMDRYNSKGYAVLYVAPDGGRLGELKSLESDVLSSDLKTLERKYPGKPSMWQNSVKGALELGKSMKKPVAVYFADPRTPLEESHAQISKDLGDRRDKFLWVLERGIAGKMGVYGLDAAPSIAVLNSKAADPAKDPLAKIVIKKDDAQETVNQALDRALEKN